METGPFPHVSTRNLVLEAANLGKIYNEVATPLKNLAEYYARLSSANHSSFIYLLIIFVCFFFCSIDSIHSAQSWRHVPDSILIESIGTKFT